MQISMLVFLSLLPCFCLLAYILYMDRRDPLPFDLLMKVAGLGALTVIPAAIIENMLLIPGSALTRPLFQAFLVLAPLEELCKIWVVFRLAWHHPAFDEENDGIVYAGMSALGFAAMNNVRYLLEHGFAGGTMEGLLSGPMHVVAGIIAGYQLGQAHFTDDPAQRRSHIWKGFVGAVVLHAIFEYFLQTGKPEMALFVLPLGFFQLWIGLSLTGKGRNLSLRRWGSTGDQGVDWDEASGDPPPPVYGPGRWKILVSRTIFGLVVGFFVMLMTGLIRPDPQTPVEFSQLMVGGLVATCIPAMLALALEMSWRFHQGDPSPPVPGA